MNKEKYCILFAGAVGSSKTPIAYYLSCHFNLPIFNHDSIRTEVAEDLLKYEEGEYNKEINLHITKDTFPNRLALSSNALNQWLNQK